MTRMLPRGFEPRSHPRRFPERRAAGWLGVDPPHLRWLVALGALARGAWAGAEREVLARTGGGSGESSRGTVLVVEAQAPAAVSTKRRDVPRVPAASVPCLARPQWAKPSDVRPLVRGVE
jgi:hypothetical protein